MYIYIYDDDIPNPNHLSSPKNLWCSLHSSSSIPANVQGCGPGKGPQLWPATVTWGFHPQVMVKMWWKTMENHGKPWKTHEIWGFPAFPKLFWTHPCRYHWICLVVLMVSTYNRYSVVFLGGNIIIAMSPTKLETIWNVQPQSTTFFCAFSKVHWKVVVDCGSIFGCLAGQSYWSSKAQTQCFPDALELHRHTSSQPQGTDLEVLEPVQDVGYLGVNIINVCF